MSAEEICKRLESKGFASTNVVLGVGSFTYQFNTRDTFGFAMKATYVEIDGEGREIFKDPITDDGVKKSAKGLLQVGNRLDPETLEPIGYSLKDQCTWSEEGYGNLQTIFEDGEHLNQTTLTEIRKRLG
jgi:nicotinamide phosphoribosyltransferase